MIRYGPNEGALREGRAVNMIEERNEDVLDGCVGNGETWPRRLSRNLV